MGRRFTEENVRQLLSSAKNSNETRKADPFEEHRFIKAAYLRTAPIANKAAAAQPSPSLKTVDVVIAGSGPIGAAYARTILDKNPNLKVLMCDVGAQDSAVIGAHHKNNAKYQMDIDSFVNVIKGALQPISVPPQDTYLATLGGNGWQPDVNETLIFQGNNPNQDPRLNLKAQAITRVVGGMATHWTACCPFPIAEEITQNPINKNELKDYLDRGRALLNVHNDQYETSIRHTTVKDTLIDALKQGGKNVRDIQSLPLAVERRKDNTDFVTWSGANTILGDTVKNKNFELWDETLVMHVLPVKDVLDEVGGLWVRKLDTDDDVIISAKAVIIAAGAVATPQILFNSKLRLPKALGRNACEQSIAFCQIVLKRELIQGIRDTTNPIWQEKIAKHKKDHPKDPLPIPFNDPEPQVLIPAQSANPWHCQVHRDAFSYGDVGPRADARTVVDLRWFGRQEIDWKNRVYFGKEELGAGWIGGVTDIYGMPQPTFEVVRGQADLVRDQNMMQDMVTVANHLGAFLPGSTPQFMEPGLALHLTGTTRIGTDVEKSVASASSVVHGYKNLWVGGNGCIPDSTACNPTLTSIAIGLKGAEAVVQYIKELDQKS